MRDGDWLIGMGCATAIYPSNVGVATARVRLEADGHVRVQSASHEIGTGIRTVAGRVPRVLGAFTAGRIMNTRTARSQLLGGLIWGVSAALHEATEIDARTARVVNR